MKYLMLLALAVASQISASNPSASLSCEVYLKPGVAKYGIALPAVVSIRNGYPFPIRVFTFARGEPKRKEPQGAAQSPQHLDPLRQSQNDADVLLIVFEASP